MKGVFTLILIDWHKSFITLLHHILSFLKTSHTKLQSRERQKETGVVGLKSCVRIWILYCNALSFILLDIRACSCALLV